MRINFKDINADFTCKNCGWFVSASMGVSGVVNRNHCPYCLYSRHVDLFEAGDRLCACKALMTPVGVTLKRNKDKYALRGGELMLVHCCTDCGALSINRIAADDDTVVILAAFERGIGSTPQFRQQYQEAGITLLQEPDRSLVETCLYGAAVSLSI